MNCPIGMGRLMARDWPMLYHWHGFIISPGLCFITGGMLYHWPGFIISPWLCFIIGLVYNWSGFIINPGVCFIIGPALSMARLIKLYHWSNALSLSAFPLILGLYA